MVRHVYSFGGGHSDGGAHSKSTLGEKGANVCEMVNLRLPVPPGFCISAESCQEFAYRHGEFPEELQAEVKEALGKVEQLMDKKFGGGEEPLLVSVRCSAAASLPGLLGTVLNLGLNDEVLRSQSAKGNAHFVCDLYRRFIMNFAATVRQLDMEPFESELQRTKRQLDSKCMLGRKHEDGDIPTQELEALVTKFKMLYTEQTGEDFPQQPEAQLWEVVAAAFSSWDNPHAVRYRQRNEITGLRGVAVTVQAMVFGNYDECSATGSAFLRNPSTGEADLLGEWLQCAQGEDFLSGKRMPLQLTKKACLEWAKRQSVDELQRSLEYPSLEEAMPSAFAELLRVQAILLEHFEDMELVEFTVEHGEVWLLQTHMHSRVARSNAVKVAVDLDLGTSPPGEQPETKTTSVQPARPGTVSISGLEHYPEVLRFVQEIATLVEPEGFHLCTGSREEFDRLGQMMVEKGTFKRLNPAKRKDCYLVCSDPGDVARVEECTFICSEREEDAGPTNNWYNPKAMKAELRGLFKSCMRGRTMYVIPYCMGPIDSPYSKIGVQLTDSVYAVMNMHIMARVGEASLKRIAKASAQKAQSPFVPGVHSVGYPLVLADGTRRDDTVWPCNLENRYITHFPETREIWSFGSGYGGNALLGKKCFALRIASVLGRDEGWMAEHMLILKLTSPEGEVRHVTAAFPSACGKTNLAMLQPTLPGWKVECVGDDIAWMHFGEDGRLYAINPEAGFFGVAPGTNDESNFNAMRSFDENAIFTNVALTEDGDVWWEGMTKEKPEKLTDWRGNKWTPGSEANAAHANSRFTCPARQCPTLAPEFEAPTGVPIDAILFGGRRDDTQPLVVESLNWEHGTFLGATMASKKTAAAAGKVGELRFDPMAILPFCGYNMADYWQHWLNMGMKGGDKMPKIFYVNWFRKSENGKFIWPGFGENIRVLKWISDRCAGRVGARDTAIGRLPNTEDLDCSGLSLTEEQTHILLSVHREEWERFVPEVEKHLAKFGDRLPSVLQQQLDKFRKGVQQLPEKDTQPKVFAPPPRQQRCIRCNGEGFIKVTDMDAEEAEAYSEGPYPGTIECPVCTA